MARAQGPPAGSEFQDANASPASVLHLLQQHFPNLASAADQLLFEPQCEKKDIFGVFQYANIVNTACLKAIPVGVRVGGAADAHSTSVVWIAASFLFCQKLLRVGASLDAGMPKSCPILLDGAMLSKHCSTKDETPVRACTHSLSVAHVQVICEANMKLLMPAQLYTAYTDIICALAKEILTTSLTAVAVQAMLMIGGVANTAFFKCEAYSNEVNLKRPPGGPRFPKENISHDLIQSLTRPLYGHHPILTGTVATCGNLKNPKTGDIDWPGTMKRYEGGLVWLLDWNVAGRDFDCLPAHVGTLVAPDNNTGVEPALDTTKLESFIIREKTRIGCISARWDTATENVLIGGQERRLACHRGWLCQQPDIVREILLVTTTYFHVGLWPAGEWNNVQELWWDILAYMGMLSRGWLVDHDTEAGLAEHNGMNWVCKLCANKMVARIMMREKDMPLRSVRAQRLSWAPQLYSFYSRRQCGFVRRVYSAKFFSQQGIPWGAVSCSGFDHSVAVPTNCSLESMIVYLLNLAGLAVDDAGVKRIAAAMPGIVNPTALGVCDKCEYHGMGLDMMMYGHGTMVIAAILAEPARRRFCWEMDGYGGRAFPTLFSRTMTGCACIGYWIEEITQLGYEWGLDGCGSDSCCEGTEAPAALPLPSPVAESGADWSKRSRVKANLQALMEACKVQFEAMDWIKDQMDAGVLEEGWNMLTCVDEVRAMGELLGMETMA